MRTPPERGSPADRRAESIPAETAAITIGRRDFVGRATGIVAAMALSGCASVVATRVTPAAGVVRLPLRDYPQLSQPDGFLKLQPEGSPTPVYLLALGGGELAAVSPICTHLGCTVNVEGRLLVCPCHGSTYERTGAVVRGPAERPLRRLPATVNEAGEIVIQLETSA